jgi:methylenetetrahydrofolate dehydrogenase (NADP+) / methenyltetrahydrofolate cyclohydrolase
MASQAQVIEGKAIADKIKSEAHDLMARVHAAGRTVRVAVVSASEEHGAQLYVGKQCANFGAAGIEAVQRVLPGHATEADLLAAIEELNRDEAVTGIVVALPLPRGIHVRRVQEAIRPVKDIEGVHPHNLGMLTLGKLRTGPSTAQAVVEIVDAAGIDPRGKEAVVVGHSEIVGKPVALALMERMATVTVCHVATRDLAAHARRAEILVVAVGRPRLITGDMVREGALVIDVGINRVTGADGKPCTVGDVDFAAACARAGWITPVPGGVGPVTVAVLLRSAVYAATRAIG